MEDHTRGTKKFIGFINKAKGVRRWVNDYDFPTLYAYDTPEEKQIATEVAERLVCWSEIEDVEGVIFTRTNEVIPMFQKRNSAHIIKKYEDKFEVQKQKQHADNIEKRKKKKNENKDDAESTSSDLDGNSDVSNENNSSKTVASPEVKLNESGTKVSAVARGRKKVFVLPETNKEVLGLSESKDEPITKNPGSKLQPTVPQKTEIKKSPLEKISKPKEKVESAPVKKSRLSSMINKEK